MTIATTSNRNDYTGNGATTVFAYTEKILASTDMTVYVAGVLVTTGYTVSGVGNPTGGSVTFTTAPANAVAVALVRAAPYTQATDYVEGDPFSAETHETALDKLTILVQQVKEITDRSLKFGTSSTKTNITLPNLVANGYLQANAAATGVDFVLLTTTNPYAGVITTKGDLVRGGTAGVAERIPGGGTRGAQFTVTGTSADTPDWTTAGQIADTVVNRTGVALVASDVVALRTATSSEMAVVLDDTVGSLAQFAVRAGDALNGASLANAAAGAFYLSSPNIAVKSTGTILRGEYVRKSATTKAVETTAVTAAATTRAPRGALGIALADASGGFVVISLFGFTNQGDFYPGGSLWGLTLSNGTDTTNDLNIAVGECVSDDALQSDRVAMAITTAMGKQLDVAWASGGTTGVPKGGRATAVIANDTYHVFAIFNPTTLVTDVIFDDNVAGTNIAAAASGFTKKRRIGSIARAAGTLPLFTQTSDTFELTTPVADIANPNPGTAAVTCVLASVPTDVVFTAFGAVGIIDAGGTAAAVYLSPLTTTDAAASFAAAPLGFTFQDNGNGGVGFFSIRTNTAASIRCRISNSAGGTTVRIVPYGWIDTRGRLA